jgi:hypothetical protein
MAKQLTKGGKVAWNTPQGKTAGQVEEKVTGRKRVGNKGHTGTVEILEKKADISDADLDHMRKVNGYVKRHLAQGPEKDVEERRWRYSLMNWANTRSSSG